MGWIRWDSVPAIMKISATTSIITSISLFADTLLDDEEPQQPDVVTLPQPSVWRLACEGYPFHP